MTPKEVLELVKERDIKILDFRFNDLPGLWQHFSMPAFAVDEGMFEEGLGFDGSSIRGFQKIQESDMILMPDSESAFIDPILNIPTMAIICNIYDPITRQPYTRDPRYIAEKAENYLMSTGIADTAYFGPEAEFFIFDEVRFDQNTHEAFYHIDSKEGAWNTGRQEAPNLGYKPRYKEGYFPCPPHDSLQDIRSEMVLLMKECGVDTEVHHHEVATGGQCEIDMRFDKLKVMADKLLIYKYIIKNVALKHNRVATFMPKPLFQDNGSGMHCHQSLWRDGKNIFYDPSGYALLSDTAKYYIGGILKHANALMAFCAPTTNSYKRLVPGFEAPVNLAYSQRNRSAAIRIPVYSSNPKARRIEFRSPDPACMRILDFLRCLWRDLMVSRTKLIRVNL